MLQDKERVYFEGLLIKKMKERANHSGILEPLKVDDHEKHSDLVDLAAFNQNRNIKLLLLEMNKAKIDGFKDALERIRKGTYGMCEGCNERISKKRLKVIPFTRFCINCQRENEMRTMEALC